MWALARASAPRPGLARARRCPSIGAGALELAPATSESASGERGRAACARSSPAHRARALHALGAVVAIPAAEAAARAWLLYHPVRGLGLAARQATALLLAGGALGLVGFRAGGWLADTRGRRPALLAGAPLFAIGVAGFYGATPPRRRPGPRLARRLALVALAAGGNAALATFRAHAAELLPPPVRGTFGGLLAVGGALGWSLSMWSVAALAERVGRRRPRRDLRGAGRAPLAALLLRRLPETAVPRSGPLYRPSGGLAGDPVA